MMKSEEGNPRADDHQGRCTEYLARPQSENERSVERERRKRLSERPGDGGDTGVVAGDGAESRLGQVEVARGGARGARVGDRGVNAASSRGRADVNLLAAVGSTRVHGRGQGDNVVRVGVDGAAVTGVATLVEVGGGSRVRARRRRRVGLLGLGGGLGGRLGCDVLLGLGGSG